MSRSPGVETDEVVGTDIPLTERWLPRVLWAGGAIALWLVVRPTEHQCAVWDQFACDTWLGLAHRLVFGCFTFWLFAGTATLVALVLDAVHTGLVRVWRWGSLS